MTVFVVAELVQIEPLPISGFAGDRIPLKMTVFVVAELVQIEPLPVLSVTCAHYSSGSTTFGEIAPVSGAPYNRHTLVLDSPAGWQVGRP